MLKGSQKGFLLIYITCMSCVSTTPLIGTYSEVFPPNIASFESEQYTFLENNRFIYYFSSDMVPSNAYGKGIYKKIKDSIYFYFDGETLDTTSSKISITNTSETKTGTSIYKVTVRSEEDKVMPFVYIGIRDSIGLTTNVVTTGKDGKAEILAHKKLHPKTLIVSLTGYQEISFPLLQDQNANFQVVLATKKGDVLEKSMRKYKLIYKTNGSIVIGDGIFNSKMGK